MIELLAPAGSYESLKAAVNAGADAVYMGGSRFGARAYADNPEEDLFIEGLRYAHRYGVKVYMTVNTLFKPGEIRELPGYIRPYYEAGVDAVLVQDLGALKVLSREYPDLPLHASTQMTLTGKYGAALMKELGLSRIVPARELSLEDIKDIRKNVDIEVETFVHGALCYSYSGQCLMSSLIGGRSGNRGRCAQPCRLEYACRKEKGPLLSLKDLCALDILPDLIEAGIDSFKIEGRMKSPRYTAGVTEIWRKYIDRYVSCGRKGYRVEKCDRKQLLDLFDRGGQTKGYYFQHNGPDMMAWEAKRDRRDNEALYRRLDEMYVENIRVLKLSGHAEVYAGEPVRLKAVLKERGIEVCLSGPAVQTAKNVPMTADDIRRQLSKTGGSPYGWEELTVDCGEDVFLPVSALNALRRDVLAEVERRVQSEYLRTSACC